LIDHHRGLPLFVLFIGFGRRRGLEGGRRRRTGDDDDHDDSGDDERRRRLWLCG